MEKVELLAPAKNFKAIKAATPFANSIYFGIKKFNMRMRTENFGLGDLNKIADYCRNNNLKTYLTTNILMYDNELEELRDVIENAKNARIDAVIVHDLAALQIAKDNERHSEAFDESGPSKIERLLYIFKMHDEIRRKDVADLLGVEEKTITRKIQILSKYNLVDSGPRGYFKKPKFIKVLRRLARDEEADLTITNI